MSEMLQRHIREVEADLQAKAAAMAARKREIVLRQRQQRAALEAAHVARHQQETQERAGRFAKGLRGLWDRLTGTHGKIRARNESETARTRVRDRDEKDQLVFRQLDERRALHRDLKHAKRIRSEQVAALHQDIAVYVSPQTDTRMSVRDPFSRASPCLPWRQSPGEREGRIANVEPGSFEAVAATPTLWSPSLHEFLNSFFECSEHLEKTVNVSTGDCGALAAPSRNGFSPGPTKTWPIRPLSLSKTRCGARVISIPSLRMPLPAWLSVLIVSRCSETEVLTFRSSAALGLRPAPRGS